MPLAAIGAPCYARLMSTYIESQIALRRARLLELDRDRLTVEAELRAYEDAMRHLSGTETAETPTLSPYHTEPHAGGGFQMSPGWFNTLRAINGRGRSFSAQDMIAAGAAFGFEIKTLNARSQLFQYNKKRIIKRVAPGKYAFTQKGRDMLQKKEDASAAADGQENGASEASAQGTS
jgi:hypothetical protein